VLVPAGGCAAEQVARGERLLRGCPGYNGQGPVDRERFEEVIEQQVGFSQ